jgi:hypothetical protein
MYGGFAKLYLFTRFVKTHLRYFITISANNKKLKAFLLGLANVNQRLVAAMSKLRRANWANMLIDDDREDEFTPEIIEGDGIYGYDYYWYHEKFPKEWALSHKEGTGPSQCENCADHGCINEVFVGYCANCAQYIYDGERGIGFLCAFQGLELNSGEDDSLLGRSALETYLKGVDLSIIRLKKSYHTDEIENALHK